MKTVTALLSQEERLRVPRFEQKQRVWCGPAALQSILVFNDCLVSQDEIASFMDMEQGCYIQDLGTFALLKGFDVTVFSYDMIYLDPTWSRLSSDEIVERIALRVSETRPTRSALRNYRSLMEFISNGGNLSIALPKKEFMVSTLQQGVPILAVVNSNSLYDRARMDVDGRSNDVAGFAAGHFLVITGYKNGYFFVIDPSYDNPISVVHEDRLMFSLSLWGGWMMVINEEA